MKQLVFQLLGFLTKRILKKYKPKVIGITGSVGKTSAKQAIYNLVSTRFTARMSPKNYNNEFGLPFTVLGVESPGRDLLLWIKLFLKAIGLLLFKQKYPQILVLEMGIDRIGDMDYLMSLVSPDIGVITNISFSHYEFFKSLAEIESEKGKLAVNLKPSATLVLNADSEIVLRQSQKTKAAIKTYGFLNKQADLAIMNLIEELTDKPGTSFSVKYKNEIINLRTNAIGYTHISALICAITVSDILDIDKTSVIKGVENYTPAPGRLNLIPGIKHSLIIDDTYNSSPESTKQALKLLERMPQTNKVAVLGDMLELGEISNREHENIGKLCAPLGLNALVVIGDKAAFIGKEAISAGMTENSVHFFTDQKQALPLIEKYLAPDSVILVKGSQGMRLEKIVKEIMAEPMKAKDLLCRQYGKWLLT